LKVEIYGFVIAIRRLKNAITSAQGGEFAISRNLRRVAILASRKKYVSNARRFVVYYLAS